MLGILVLVLPLCLFLFFWNKKKLIPWTHFPHFIIVCFFHYFNFPHSLWLPQSHTLAGIHTIISANTLALLLGWAGVAVCHYVSTLAGMLADVQTYTGILIPILHITQLNCIKQGIKKEKWMEMEETGVFTISVSVCQASQGEWGWENGRDKVAPFNDGSGCTKANRGGLQ